MLVKQLLRLTVLMEERAKLGNPRTNCQWKQESRWGELGLRRGFPFSPSALP